MIKQSLLLVAVAGSLSAQQTPPVRLINAPDAQSSHVFGFVAGVRQLPDGRVLVNDILHRQLLALDPTLATVAVVADSVDGANAYGPGPGSLVAYFADSTLFIDPRDLSMFVIDPKGAIARVAAVPRSQDAGMMGGGLGGSPAIDPKGRLVYRAGFGRLGALVGPKGAFAPPDFPDSAAIVRVDLATRKVDTAAFFKIQKTKINVTQTDRGMTVTTEINPLPIVDDWAMLPDGSIAIVRGRDYHIDWVKPEGGMTSSPKIPFDWQRLSDEDKGAVIDSARAQMERARASAAGGNMIAGIGGGPVVMNMNIRTSDGAAGAKGARADANMPPVTFTSASDLPDYRPAITAGAARADLDGNLWIRTSATRSGAIGGPIYDIVNEAGALLDRVQIPAGRQIVGFGKGGVVYMLASDNQSAWLERTKR
jgi:hypothetical protein